MKTDQNLSIWFNEIFFLIPNDVPMISAEAWNDFFTEYWISPSDGKYWVRKFKLLTSLVVRVKVHEDQERNHRVAH